MKTLSQLSSIHYSNKPYIIQKSEKGFDVYTDFSKKIILNNKNIFNFLNKKFKDYSKINSESAINHPKWKMGKKFQ